MAKLEKPTARGPSPDAKAKKALGNKLNRKPKPPPKPLGSEVIKGGPADRRLQE